MPKHKKVKRLSIERVCETESPDTTKEISNNTSNNTKKDDKDGCRCCGVLDCFKIETTNNNSINGKNNVIDNNKETSLNVGVNAKK